MDASADISTEQRQRLEDIPAGRAISEDSVDISLLEESLAKTVWERMLANDDALRLADCLQAAVMKSRAK